MAYLQMLSIVTAALQREISSFIHDVTSEKKMDKNPDLAGLLKPP